MDSSTQLHAIPLMVLLNFTFLISTEVTLRTLELELITTTTTAITTTTLGATITLEPVITKDGELM